VIVIEVPTGPAIGFVYETVGGVPTVKFTLLLATPPTVTTTGPVVAPLGTGATTCVLLQLVGVATVPLKVIELVPCVEPKLLPTILTEVPMGPFTGFV
jgi:hypothetical protein